MNRRWDLLGPLGILILQFAAATYLGAQLPPSKGAPRVGEKAAEFTLSDTTGKPVKLSELLATPAAQQSGSSGSRATPGTGPKTQGVLLIFYRGYW